MVGKYYICRSKLLFLNIQAYIESRLNQLKKEGGYRYFLQLNKSARHFPVFYYESGGKTRRAVNFCSNDYLGMSVEEEVIGKLSFVVHQSGTGSGGTRNISGTTQQHQSLEQTLCAWHQKAAALIFGSAYLANLTALQTLGRQIPELVFFSDERNHASLIEGMRSAGNRKLIFQHNDIVHLEELLQKESPDIPKLIVFESVYSMNGSVAHISDFIRLAKKYNAFTYVDEVHAIGLYGESGAGICEQEGLLQHVDIINGTLAKSVGVIGGYIAGSQQIIDFIRSFGSGFIFTTSLPPAICSAAEKSIQLIRHSSALRTSMHGMVVYLRRLLDEERIAWKRNSSHITTIVIGQAIRCKRIADRLLDEFGLYVQPVNHPTVPLGEECLRLIVTARHNREQIILLVNSLKTILIEEGTHHMQA
jgi:5-aminolevulinate synthase